MSVYFIFMVSSFVFLTGSALLALRWAVRHGELEHLDKRALQIFDETEPLGKLSDSFPPPRGAHQKTADE